ncbi:MAG: hypothetical protein MK033_00520 [Candidatus Caenarcaniphilales bacterium]|nr:hypothetical protein [Candidatus Caenarcaniphilales bacterium]
MISNQKDHLTILRHSQDPSKLRLETYTKTKSARVRETQWSRENDSKINKDRATVENHIIDTLNAKNLYFIQKKILEITSTKYLSKLKKQSRYLVRLSAK